LYRNEKNTLGFWRIRCRVADNCNLHGLSVACFVKIDFAFYEKIESQNEPSKRVCWPSKRQLRRLEQGQIGKRERRPEKNRFEKNRFKKNRLEKSRIKMKGVERKKKKRSWLW
jgi:hypothetical protein